MIPRSAVTIPFYFISKVFFVRRCIFVGLYTLFSEFICSLIFRPWFCALCSCCQSRVYVYMYRLIFINVYFAKLWKLLTNLSRIGSQSMYIIACIRIQLSTSDAIVIISIHCNSIVRFLFVWLLVYINCLSLRTDSQVTHNDSETNVRLNCKNDIEK